MQNGPINTAQFDRLERDYVLPMIKMLLENIRELELPLAKTELIFGDLLKIITEENVSEKSSTLPFKDTDTDLQAHITAILATLKDKEKEENAFGNIYQILHILVHEYYLNKSPDSEEDTMKNTETAGKFIQEQISREQLYEETLNVFNKLSLRLLAYGPQINDEVLQSAVVNATQNAMMSALESLKVEDDKPKENELVTSPTFTPAYRDPVLLQRAQIARDRAYAEELAQQLADEEQIRADEEFARRLQNEDDSGEENSQDEGSDEDNTRYYDQDNGSDEDSTYDHEQNSGDDRDQQLSQNGNSDDSAQYYDQEDTPDEDSEVSEESSNDSYSPGRKRRRSL